MVRAFFKVGVLITLVAHSTPCTAQQGESLVERLVRAAMARDSALVHRLLDEGANIDGLSEYGQTALMVAAGSDARKRVHKSGSLQLTRLLLRRGADPNVAGNVFNRRGATALYEAAFDGKLEVVELLLDYGARVDQATRLGTTPLMMAAANGHLDVVRRLVEDGANINAENNDGRTVLDFAIRGCPLALALPTTKTRSCVFGDRDVVLFLTDRGAKAANYGQSDVMSRDTIARAQLQLASLGYDPGATDGMPGPQTARALRMFQNDNGFSMSGAFTSEVMEELLTRNPDQQVLPWEELSDCDFLRGRRLRNRLRIRGGVTASLDTTRLRLAEGEIRGGPYDAMGLFTYVVIPTGEPVVLCGWRLMGGDFHITRRGFEVDMSIVERVEPRESSGR